MYDKYIGRKLAVHVTERKTAFGTVYKHYDLDQTAEMQVAEWFPGRDVLVRVPGRFYPALAKPNRINVRINAAGVITDIYTG